MYQPDPDFPAQGPAHDAGTINPTLLRLDEAAEMQRLRDAVAKQKGMEPAPCWTINQGDASSVTGPLLQLTYSPDEGIECRGAQDGSAMGWVSKEEGTLSRMNRLMAYRERRRQEYRAAARAVFVANKAIDVMTFSAFVKAGQRRLMG